MARRHLAVFGLPILVGLVALGLATIAYAHDDDMPSSAQIAAAQDVSALLANEVVAALFQEFNETTAANVEHGKQAISLIFNNRNKDIRLIGTFEPQGGANNRPSDSFENAALAAALTGQPQTGVEKVEGQWLLRRSIPLSNTFHANCVLCHTNFTPQFFASTGNPGQWVGALMLRVPIDTDKHKQ